MKTFAQLIPGDKIWLGIEENEFRTISRIETDQQTGTKLIYFWEQNSVMNMQVENRLIVPMPFLNKMSIMRSGKNIYSNRKYGLQLAAEYLENVRQQVYQEIDERKRRIEKLNTDIAVLKSIMDNCYN